MSATVEQPTGRFVTGSTLRHVVVMTATSSVGLMAIFFVDLANLFYISLLGQAELAAAIGYAGTVMFFITSISIGTMIAASALISRALGRGARDEARRISGSSLVLVGGAMILLTLLLVPLADRMLALLGATGDVRDIAWRYLMIVVPSIPLLGIGMAATAILRSVGDASRAMYVTLGSGVATALIDPLLIFGFGLGVDGAAITSFLSRIIMAAIGLHGAVKIHDLVARPTLAGVKQDFIPLMSIAGPAIMTNLATPVGNAYVTAMLAPFGPAAVAGWAIVGRLIPVAFGAIFALSGAIGPILGQNLGAGRHDRIRQALNDSLVIIIGYVLVVWGVLWLAQDYIITSFAATGETASLVRLFCNLLAGAFVFQGMLFVANAAFNNLGFASRSTWMNWGRATLGTFPFVWAGAHFYGAQGVLIGQALGGVFFGIAAMLLAYQALRVLALREHYVEPTASLHPVAHSPFTTGKGGSA